LHVGFLSSARCRYVLLLIQAASQVGSSTMSRIRDIRVDVGRTALHNDILVEPLRYADGHLGVPKGPGLGVTPDDAAGRRFSRA
jgi:L-alanine-DL-glutamate epimerase-like enolase superfamily enzyme